MATTIGQAKAIIRQKFDHAEKMSNTWLAQRTLYAKEGDMSSAHDANDSYSYWLGQRTVLAELLTSIDEV